MLAILAALLTLAVAQDTSSTGSCLSGRYSFDPARMTSTLTPFPNISTYDFTIDYGTSQVLNLNPGMGLTLTNSGTNGVGVRVSTTRYMLYGRFSAAIRAPRVGGMVSTFITMSARKVRH